MKTVVEQAVRSGKRKAPPALELEDDPSPPQAPRGVTLPAANAADRFKVGVKRVMEQRERTKNLLNSEPSQDRDTPTAASYSFDGCTLFASNISAVDANETALREIFGAFGPVRSVAVRPKGDKSWALVTFQAQVGFGAALRSKSIAALSDVSKHIDVARPDIGKMMESKGHLREVYHQAKVNAGENSTAPDTAPDEAPRSLSVSDFMQGAEVRHASRGFGKVVDIDEKKVHIQYETGDDRHGYDNDSLATGKLFVVPLNTDGTPNREAVPTASYHDRHFDMPPPSSMGTVVVSIPPATTSWGEGEGGSGMQSFPGSNDIGSIEEVEKIAFIAKGTTGSVYRARWNGMQVAAKFFSSMDDDNVHRAFDTELTLMRKLNHINLLRVYGACADPHTPCLVTELMGGSLDQLLWGSQSAKNPTLSQRQVGAYANQHPSSNHRVCCMVG